MSLSSQGCGLFYYSVLLSSDSLQERGLICWQLSFRIFALLSIWSFSFLLHPLCFFVPFQILFLIVIPVAIHHFWFYEKYTLSETPWSRVQGAFAPSCQGSHLAPEIPGNPFPYPRTLHWSRQCSIYSAFSNLNTILLMSYFLCNVNKLSFVSG